MCKDGSDLRADLAGLDVSARAIDAMLLVAREFSDRYEAARHDRSSAAEHLHESLLVATNLFALVGAQVRAIARLDPAGDAAKVERTLSAAAMGVSPCEFLNSELARN